VSQFGALATALAATIGTGNIVGVAAKETKKYLWANRLDEEMEEEG